MDIRRWFGMQGMVGVGRFTKKGQYSLLVLVLLLSGCTMLVDSLINLGKNSSQHCTAKDKAKKLHPNDTHYLPPNTDRIRWYHVNQNSNTVIVFVHGFESDNCNAWLNEQDQDRPIYWPEMVLKTFDEAARPSILLAGYYAGRNNIAYNAWDIARDLMNAIEGKTELISPDDGVAGLEVLKKKNIVFVAHSTGGIIARLVLIRDPEKFQSHSIGLELIASPNMGSDYADVTKYLSGYKNNNLLIQLRIDAPFLSHLADMFEHVIEDEKIALFAGIALSETEGIQRGAPHIVNKESALYHKRIMRGEPVAGANHFTIAKPPDESFKTHQELRTLLRVVQENGEEKPGKRLRIGLASEHAESVQEVIEAFSTAARLANMGGKSRFSLEPISTKSNYNQAYEHYKAHLDDYDIVMIDDPWIPEFSERLEKLPDIPFYPTVMEKKFDEYFVKSLEKACFYEGNLYGLPVMANIQMFIYSDRGSPKDMPVPTLNSFDDWMRDKPKQKPRLVLPMKNDSDVAGLFLQLVRGYSDSDTFKHEEIERKGELKVPSKDVSKAVGWLSSMMGNWPSRMRDPEPTTEDVVGALAGGDRDDEAVTIAWPVWFHHKVFTSSELQSDIRVSQLQNRPLMGTWVLAIPAKSEKKDIALQLIHSVTTVPHFQLSMARVGTAPVVKHFPYEKILKSSSYWNNNYKALRNALETAIPRPRTPKWHSIEKNMAEKIREWVLYEHKREDKDDLIIFRAE
jgi:ABC-type glycerol-3-phosphate transport system substrate-binding protein